MTTPDLASDPISDGASRRLSRTLYRHPRVRLGLLLSGPVAWLLVAYLGSLAMLLVTSLYSIDPFNQEIVRHVSFGNFSDLLTEPVYRTVTLRTIWVAAVVTFIDVVIGVPTAFFMAKVARPRWRRWLVVGL